jgi:hypothetical protein
MTNFSDRIKAATTGCRLSIGSMSVRKKITATQQAKIASLFDAELASVDGGRKIINRKLKPVAEMFRILREVRSTWFAYSIPYEPGVRLIRVDRVEWISETVAKAAEELEVAKNELHARWDEVIEDARTRLGDLFVESDYQFDVRDMVGIAVSFPAIEPDGRVAALAPEVFAAERARIAAKMEEAAVTAEAALQAQLLEMVSSLETRLVDGESEDGKKRVIRQGAVDEIVEFANRFRATAINSDAQLDEIVERAKALASGVDLSAVRKDAVAKKSLSESFGDIRKNLENYVEVKKERKFDL